MTGRTIFSKNQWNGVALAAFILLVFAFALGGASRQHELRLAMVELAALPLLVLGLTALLHRSDTRTHAYALSLLACLVGLPLLQLLPLPPGLWTSLPGRDELLLAVQITDAPLVWAPLSTTPDRTWQSALALLPPVAIFIGVLTVRPDHRVHLIYLFLFGTFAAILLGTAQMASRGDQLYLWSTTAVGSVAGFFANRNHFATMCLVSLPFAGALAGRAMRRGRPEDRMVLWLTVLFVATVVIAIGAIRSRAGIALAAPVLLATLLVTWVASGRGKPKPLLLALAGGIAIALMVVALYALPPILARFDTAGAREGRFENWPTVVEASNAYLPVGSGIGSFDTVYRSVEPLERLDPTYFNQAHNDYLETWLEAGWMGAALLAAFLLWFSRRTWAAWRAKASTARDLQRASSVAIGAILLHSAGDYPLRTVAIATLFAMFCAILELAGQPEEERIVLRQRLRS